MSAGGTLCVLADAGQGTNGFAQTLYAKWPRPLKWIIVRTDTPDNQFVPEHVRVNPQWVSKMARWQYPQSLHGAYAQSTVMFSMNGIDTNDLTMAAKVRLVGLEITYEPNPNVAS